MKHLLDVNVFQFTHDKLSTHTRPPLFYDGQQRLAGYNGGHVKYLAWQVCLRTWHSLTEGSSDKRIAVEELLRTVDSIQNIDFELESEDTAVIIPCIEELS